MRRANCRSRDKKGILVNWLGPYSIFSIDWRLSGAAIKATQRLPTVPVAQMFGLYRDRVPQ
ncbi:hypothetical protein D3C76_577450 [compost metagenome]